jgi:hypothetical protein
MIPPMSQIESEAGREGQGGSRGAMTRWAGMGWARGQSRENGVRERSGQGWVQREREGPRMGWNGMGGDGGGCTSGVGGGGGG